MKTTETKVQHTAGELKFAPCGYIGDPFYLYVDGLPKEIATIHEVILNEKELSYGEAQANAERIVQCWNEYPKIVRLLEDLTPGGSEFYNDPAYCAQWVKEQMQSVPKQIVTLKRENDTLKATNAALLEALKEFCDLRTAYSNDEFNAAYHKAKAAIKAAEQE